MKIQDIIFLVTVLILLFKRDSRLFLLTGLSAILISIPLFYLQIFFTAQRLVYYGAFFILVATIIMIVKEKTL